MRAMSYRGSPPIALALVLASIGVLGCSSEDEPELGALSDEIPPTAAQLLSKVVGCDQILGGRYASDAGGTSRVSVCGGPGVVYWTADMDIDCDGRRTEECNSSTDPSYQGQTATTDSMGRYLDAAALPFVVVPARSWRWNYRTSDLRFGSVVAVIFEDRVEYGVIGDSGPQAIIGEASYAMAERLGIDPNPRIGGTADPVTYIAFTGDVAVVDTIEDHDQAVALGVQLATALFASN